MASLSEPEAKRARLDDAPAPAALEDGSGSESEEAGSELEGEDCPAAGEGAWFEYLDHTADIQLHAHGATLTDALRCVVLCMINYSTPLWGVEEEEGREEVVEVEAEDLEKLLFKVMDEFLFKFNAEFFVPCRMEVVEWHPTPPLKLTLKAYGEEFQPAGTWERGERGEGGLELTVSRVWSIVNRVRGLPYPLPWGCRQRLTPAQET